MTLDKNGMTLHRLEEWAKERGLNQTDVSLLAETKQGRVSEWYSGKHDPSLKNLRLIADNAKCDVKDLIRSNNAND